MCVGHTLGEEVIFGQGKKLVRTESVVAKMPSCVLQVRKDIFLKIRRVKDRNAVSGVASKDFGILHYILENHFRQKQDWREEAGLFSDEPPREANNSKSPVRNNKDLAIE